MKKTVCPVRSCLRVYPTGLNECPECGAAAPRHGGARPGAGRHHSKDPKRHVHSQRYTDADNKLLESMVGPDESVNDFIHDAAVDRARLFAEQGVGQ